MGSIDARTIMDKAARQVERNASVQVGQKRCSGFVQCGLGESTLVVPFPVIYVEKPIITYGAEFPAGQVLVPGRWPVISSIFQLTQTGMNWTGMNLYIVFGGGAVDPTYKALIHWNAAGKALTNPRGATS